MDTVESIPRHIAWFRGWEKQPEVPPDDLLPLIPGAEIILHEWQEYRVTIPGADLLMVGNIVYPPFKHGEHHFAFTISNRLGPTRITPHYGNHWGAPLVAEVIATKFASIRTSLHFMTNIVDELSGFAAELPFIASAETLRQVRRTHGTPSLLFSFHYLRHHGRELLRALQIIAADPHRTLSDLIEYIRVDQVKHVDADTISSLLRGPRAGEPSRESGSRVLDRLQPLQAKQQRPEETHNTPENRFVIAALDRIRKLIAEIREQTWWKSHANSTDHLLFDDLEKSIRRMLLGAPWREIAASASFPAYSRVLQQRHGYRDLTRFWNGLSQITVPILQQLDRAIDLRDVPTLYEYWLFFALVHAFETATECKADYSVVQNNSEISWSMKAHIAGQGSLLTQKTYGSYTPFAPRPDFVWESNCGTKVVLDAKFAISQIGEPGPDADDTPPSKAKERDIAKMHAYRDAIDGVRTAFVLFPGTNGRFWSADGRVQFDVGGIEQVIDLIVDGKLDGIGAIPMSPVRGLMINEI